MRLKIKSISRWYWLLGLLLASILIGFLTGVLVAVAILLLGAVAVLRFEPSTYFIAGLAVCVLTGILLAARADSLSASTAILAFVMFCAGTLLGATRVFTWERRTEDGVDGPGDERERAG